MLLRKKNTLQSDPAKSSHPKSFRNTKKHGENQLLFGVNKVTTLALGKTHEDSYRPKLHLLSKYLKGQCALLFSRSSPAELREQLDAFRSSEYSRPGVIAEQTVSLKISSLTYRLYVTKLEIPIKVRRNRFEKRYLFVIATRMRCTTVEISEFRVSLLAVWIDGEGVEELAEKDSCMMRTSLHPEVLVVCKQLDDGLYYFIPQPYEKKGESFVNEAMEED
ncbi:putative mrna turnover protein 4 mrt4 [Schistosoma mansoni]|uniref:putative mrna turnover protein 4 mrt4 n=1 Tax=Schistosoma mansoni TaxID=6183 RepID=UPI00022DBF4C|nr:putative mrna turnover protein 4 mrt4 [Schistosoma mansoni]|eukprot:XP_018653989.1 putative mrna turnover protein 4 mrt4 [Schistosoma mansoni]